MFPPPYFRRSSYLPYPTNNFPTLPPPVSSPSKIDQFLQTTDQLMKTAKTYEPYIQQAKPLLKNLPAMWKIYKGFTNSSNNSPKEQRIPRTSSSPKSNRTKPPAPPIVEQPSVPRIYQPPF